MVGRFYIDAALLRGNACGDNPCKKGISYESRIVGLQRKRYCGNGVIEKLRCNAINQKSRAQALAPFPTVQQTTCLNQ